MLYTENETNAPRLWNFGQSGYFKDAFHDRIVQGLTDRVNPARHGTKAGVLYQSMIAAGGKREFRLRLSRHTLARPFEDFDGALAQRQREADDPSDHTIRTYYHWVMDGIDFINLDNADNMFDDAELAWATKVIASDQAKAEIRALVVGMHGALPDS